MRKLLAIIILTFISCKKEKTFLYDVNPVNVQQNGSVKNNVKNTTEFISIAYADLFGTNIPQANLVNLNTIYNAFGDKKMIEDRIILNFINAAGSVIPALPSVNGDTVQFITNTYKKLYNREPGAFEKYYFKESIRTNSTITPVMIYYALMTSDEYRFY